MKQKGYVFSIFVFAIFASVFAIAVTNAKSVAVLQEASYDEIKVMKAGNLYRNVDMIISSGEVNVALAKGIIMGEEMPFDILIDTVSAPPRVSVGTGSCDLSYGFQTAGCGCTGDCDGKECGSDGCGGSCGDCGPTEICNVAGQCISTCDNDGTCDSSETSTSCPADCPCDNDGTCDSGETSTSCPADCPCDNDGTCDSGETNTNCPADCPLCDNDGVKDPTEDCDGSALGGQICATKGFSGGTLTCTASCTFDTTNCYTCGNTVCESAKGETAANCPADCKCGDGTCGTGETAANCPADCTWTPAGYWMALGQSAVCASGYAVSNYDCNGGCGSGKSRVYCLNLPPGVTMGASSLSVDSRTPSCPSGYVVTGFDCTGNCGTDNMKVYCTQLNSATFGSESSTGDTKNQHSCGNAFSTRFDCTGSCATNTMALYCKTAAKS